MKKISFTLLFSTFFCTLSASKNCPIIKNEDLTLALCTKHDACTLDWYDEDVKKICHDLIKDAYKKAQEECKCKNAPPLNQAFLITIKESPEDCSRCLINKDFIKNLYENFTNIQKDYEKKFS